MIQQACACGRVVASKRKDFVCCKQCDRRNRNFCIALAEVFEETYPGNPLSELLWRCSVDGRLNVGAEIMRRKAAA